MIVHWQQHCFNRCKTRPVSWSATACRVPRQWNSLLVYAGVHWLAGRLGRLLLSFQLNLGLLQSNVQRTEPGDKPLLWDLKWSADSHSSHFTADARAFISPKHFLTTTFSHSSISSWHAPSPGTPASDIPNLLWGRFWKETEPKSLTMAGNDRLWLWLFQGGFPWGLWTLLRPFCRMNIVAGHLFNTATLPM